ncbi:polysaccharide export protein [Cyanobium sp. Cruz CV13-4-11]|uniref:SLBB domain-containing protein n=1 Tax=Cyanobium sp. Cruz CV11-17 TaxID=2823709 RepID=UPI0020CCC719|nr:polysaccharide biosynthesis/export family protein [Cyanobium sp. Cruz CV11-17]MCP9900229.1 polysaccharide export protein [Cyanobium sp. Cruz CV11-17]MCP9918542.1 polysaccharide export protein [Cyanobium sp. Cruz CV13-4-11]
MTTARSLPLRPIRRRLSALGLVGLTGLVFAPAGLRASVPPGLSPQTPSRGSGAVSATPGTGPSSSAPLPLSVTEVYNDLYVLGPGDALQLTFTDPSASPIGGPVVILPDGTSTLSLLGSVQLTGLTIGQATRWLTSLYAKQLVRPELILSLTGPRPVKVTIIGEVGRPGLYPLSSYSTPVSAIQTAGGVTLNADIRKVLLRRLAGPDGSQKQTVLDLAQVFQAGNQRQNPILFDGDTIVIARTEELIPEEILQIGATNLAPATITVSVIGEVRSPGTLSLPANTPLAEAIFRAGGAENWRANKNDIELVRLNRNGTSTREVFSYRDGIGVSKGLNPPLRDRDTIIVNRTFYAEALDVINQVVVPLSQAASSYYLFRDTFNGNRNSNFR